MIKKSLDIMQRRKTLMSISRTPTALVIFKFHAGLLYSIANRVSTLCRCDWPVAVKFASHSMHDRNRVTGAQ